MAQDRDERSDIFGTMIPIVVILVILGGVSVVAVLMVKRARDTAMTERAMAEKRAVLLQDAIRVESETNQRLQAALIAEKQSKVAAQRARISLGNVVTEAENPVNELPTINVLIDRDGVFSIDGEELDQGGLETRLSDPQHDAIARFSVQIEAHPECPAKYLAAAYSICKKLGLENVAFTLTKDSGDSGDEP